VGAAAAITPLLAMLRPDDLALLRLLLQKRGLRLTAPPAPAPLPPPSRPGVKAGAAAAAAAASAAAAGTAALHSLAATVDATLRATPAPKYPPPLAPAPGGSAVPTVAQPPARLPRTKRVALVRLWVVAAVRRALGLPEPPAATTRRRAQGRRRAVAAPATTAPTADEEGDGDEAGAGGRHQQRPAHRLSRLKKAILQQRVDKWLAAHPEAAAVYQAERSARRAREDRLSTAERTARQELRALALAELQAAAAARRQRLIDAGKLTPEGLPLPRRGGTAAAGGAGGGAGGGKPGASGGGAKKGGVGKAAAAPSTKPATYTKKQVRRVMKSLIASGRGLAPHAAALAVAADLHEALGDGGAGSGSDHDSDSGEVGEAGGKALTGAMAVAHALAAMDITRGTAPRDINKLLARSGASPPPAAAATAAAADTAAAASGGARSYVDQDLSTQLDAVLAEMASSAYFYQERSRLTDTRKGSVKRRLLLGMREVMRAVVGGKVKAVVVVPNVEETGAADDAVDGIVAAARGNGTPVLFGLSRRRLAAALGIRARVSVAAFLTFENLKGLHTVAFAMADALRGSFAARGDNVARTIRDIRSLTSADVAAAAVAGISAVQADRAAGGAPDERDAGVAAPSVGGGCSSGSDTVARIVGPSVATGGAGSPEGAVARSVLSAAAAPFVPLPFAASSSVGVDDGRVMPSTHPSAWASAPPFKPSS